jgi:hypothetical protein
MDREWIIKFGDKLKKLLEKDAWNEADLHVYFALFQNLVLKLHLEKDPLFHLDQPPMEIGEAEIHRAKVLFATIEGMIK